MRVGGRAGTYSFNESRIEQVLRAASVDEATKMGWLDQKIDDWLRGGVKGEAITNLYNALTTDSQKDRCSPKVMFERFEELKRTASTCGNAEFGIVVKRPDPHGPWSFAFRKGDKVIYRSEGLQNGPGQYHTEFWLRAALQANPLNCGAAQSRETPLGNIWSMSDLDAQREWISRWENRTNPAFSRANFRRIERLNNKTFAAVFQKSDGPEFMMVFSDRPSTEKKTLRGAVLRDALQHGDYANLYDIVTRRYLPGKVWREAASTMGFPCGASLSKHLASLPDPDERRAVTEMLRGMRYGQTNLAELYCPDANPAPHPNVYHSSAPYRRWA
jgi:hypothetical protein